MGVDSVPLVYINQQTHSFNHTLNLFLTSAIKVELISVPSQPAPFRTMFKFIILGSS